MFSVSCIFGISAYIIVYSSPPPYSSTASLICCLYRIDSATTKQIDVKFDIRDAFDKNIIGVVWNLIPLEGGVSCNRNLKCVVSRDRLKQFGSNWPHRLLPTKNTGVGGPSLLKKEGPHVRNCKMQYSSETFQVNRNKFSTLFAT